MLRCSMLPSDHTRASICVGLDTHTHVHVHIHIQAKAYEDKCKELREELTSARDEVNTLSLSLADSVPRAELAAAVKVRMLCF